MKRRMCTLLVALGGSLLPLVGCSSFAERLSRPGSRAESTTAAENSMAKSRTSEDNATEGGKENTAETFGEVENDEEQLAMGESAGGESAAETAANGETFTAAKSSAEGAVAEVTAAESAVAETPRTLTRRSRNLAVGGDSLSVGLVESIDDNSHLDYDGEPVPQTEDREDDTLCVKESGAMDKLPRIAVSRGTNLETLSFTFGAGDLTITGVNTDSLMVSVELGDVTPQTVNAQCALSSPIAGELRMDVLSTNNFETDAGLSNLTATLAESLVDLTLFARAGQGIVYSQGAIVDSKFLQRGSSNRCLLFRSEMGNVTISGIRRVERYHGIKKHFRSGGSGGVFCVMIAGALREY